MNKSHLDRLRRRESSLLPLPVVSGPRASPQVSSACWPAAADPVRCCDGDPSRRTVDDDGRPLRYSAPPWELPRSLRFLSFPPFPCPLFSPASCFKGNGPPFVILIVVDPDPSAVPSSSRPSLLPVAPPSSSCLSIILPIASRPSRTLTATPPPPPPPPRPHAIPSHLSLARSL